MNEDNDRGLIQKPISSVNDHEQQKDEVDQFGASASVDAVCHAQPSVLEATRKKQSPMPSVIGIVESQMKNPRGRDGTRLSKRQSSSSLSESKGGSVTTQTTTETSSSSSSRQSIVQSQTKNPRGSENYRNTRAIGKQALESVTTTDDASSGMYAQPHQNDEEQRLWSAPQQPSPTHQIGAFAVAGSPDSSPQGACERRDDRDVQPDQGQDSTDNHVVNIPEASVVNDQPPKAAHQEPILATIITKWEKMARRAMCLTPALTIVVSATVCVAVWMFSNRRTVLVAVTSSPTSLLRNETESPTGSGGGIVTEHPSSQPSLKAIQPSSHPTVPTSSPSADALFPPSPGFPPCSFCGEGHSVTNWVQVIDVPGHPTNTCIKWQLYAASGFIKESECPQVQQAAIPCVCTRVTPPPPDASEKPSTSLSVSPASIRKPTESSMPASQPSHVPLIEPIFPAPIPTPSPLRGGCSNSSLTVDRIRSLVPTLLPSVPFDSPSSAEYRALEWMKCVDEMDHQELSDDRLVQRFAIASLLMGVNGTGGLLTSDSECTLSEVFTCNGANQLTRIKIQGELNGGQLPPAIGLLSNLTEFNITGGALSGTIPSELGMLKQLRNLSLSNNTLTGTIPVAIGSLTELERLSLDMNMLGGSIPLEVGTLSNLVGLRLFDNKLAGSIHSSIGSLVKMEQLDLYKNRLTGTIPAELFSMTRLIKLVLTSNSFIGTIPSGIGSLANVTWLDLSSNHLDGSIPVEIGSMKRLRLFSLAYNSISGTIPVETGSLAELKWLYLHSNKNLTGSIPSGLLALSNLSELWLASTELNGSIPTEMCGRMDVRPRIDCGKVVCTCCTTTLNEDCPSPGSRWWSEQSAPLLPP